MTREEREEEELFVESDPDKELASLIFFEQLQQDDPIPEGFTAVTCRLDGTPSSSLNWEQELQHARNLIKQGYKIAFDLDLGLSDTLQKPLAHKTQFQTLLLAIDRFCTEVLPEMGEHAPAVILARTSLPIQLTHESDDQAHLMACEYLQLLAEPFPDSIAPLVLLDCSGVTSPLVFAQLTAADYFGKIRLALRSPLFAKGHLIWQAGTDYGGYIGRTLPPRQSKPDAKIGIMLPASGNAKSLEPLLEKLLAEQTPFRIIHEERLTAEWEGLEKIILPVEGVAESTQRKLQGFIAAEGEVEI